jgi:hypothetical protein
MGELGSLNPRVNLHKMTVGTSLKVASELRPVATPPLPKSMSAPLRVKTGAPVSPVAPLPETPAIGPGSTAIRTGAPRRALPRLRPWPACARSCTRKAMNPKN